MTARPPSALIAAAAIAVAIFLLGGGVYDILEKPLMLIPGGPRGRFIFYYPYTLNEQTLHASLIVMLLYAIAVAGFLLVYRSTKYAYRPRNAYILLLVGAVFIVLAYLYCEYIIGLKMGV